MDGIPKEFNNKIDEICKQWNKAEKAMKIAEGINGNVVYPSINELRYAGRKLIEYMESRSVDSETNQINTLESARVDCMKATHDAVDTSISFVKLELDNIRKNIPANSILKIDGFQDIYALVARMGDKIPESRENRNKRNEIYENIINDGELNELKEGFNSIKSNMELIENVAKEDRIEREKTEQESKRNRMFAACGIVIGIIGIVIGVFF